MARTNRRLQRNENQSSRARRNGQGKNERRRKIDKYRENTEKSITLTRDVIKKLEQCGNFNDEVKTLLTMLYGNQEKIVQNRRQVENDILDQLRQQFSAVEVHAFGSSVTGMAFECSDYDFYINAPNDDDISPKEKIEIASKALKPNFVKFTKITETRVPLLKCMHKNTKFVCDINFSNPFGVENSKILKHLLSKLDQRIHSLATILKVWMKVHSCSGQNGISNYGVVWLVLFYLQQLAEPLLPPIIEFQLKIEPKLVRDMNYAFNFELKFETQNKDSIFKLLHGFFDFYRNFDFKSTVICPLLGRHIAKNEILDDSVIIPEFDRLRSLLRGDEKQKERFEKREMSILDPFEITFIFPVNLSPRFCHEFKRKLLLSFELMNGRDDHRALADLFNVRKFNQPLKIVKDGDNSHEIVPSTSFSRNSTQIRDDRKIRLKRALHEAKRVNIDAKDKDFFAMNILNEAIRSNPNCQGISDLFESGFLDREDLDEYERILYRRGLRQSQDNSRRTHGRSRRESSSSRSFKPQRKRARRSRRFREGTMDRPRSNRN